MREFNYNWELCVFRTIYCFRWLSNAFSNPSLATYGILVRIKIRRTINSIASRVLHGKSQTNLFSWVNLIQARCFCSFRFSNKKNHKKCILYCHLRINRITTCTCSLHRIKARSLHSQENIPLIWKWIAIWIDQKGEINRLGLVWNAIASQ